MKRVVKEPKKQRALTKFLNQSNIKLEIGRQIAEAIVDRTLEGVDKNGKDFKAYKKSYIKSDDFKIYGKKSSDVNLKLTGAMLSAIEVVKLTPTGVVIWINDSKERKKASGHIYGDNPNKMPIRDFWDLPNDYELEAIFDDVVSNSISEIEAISEVIETSLNIGVGNQDPLLFGAL